MWVVSALALTVITVLATTGEDVDAAPATVSAALGSDSVGDEIRECLRRHRRQPALSSEICAGLDEIVGAPDASAVDDVADKTNATVVAVNPATSGPDAAKAANMRNECVRQYRWQPWLRDEFCATLDELVGGPSAPAAETEGGDTPGEGNR